MTAIRRAFAALEWLLVLPAVIFFLSLLLAVVQPVLGTGRIVGWYAHHLILGLYVALCGMPVAALAAGSAFMLHDWSGEAGLRQKLLEARGALREVLAPSLIAAAMLTACATLVLVALHLVTE